MENKRNDQLEYQDHTPQEKKRPVIVWADGVSLPENIGGLFRLADAMGVEKIIFSGAAFEDLNLKKVDKLSRSTMKYVKYETREDTSQILKEFKQAGYEPICLEYTHQSVDLNQYSFESHKKICLIIGSEKYGISDELLKSVSHTVHIPMRGKNSSMNVTMACAIALNTILTGTQ